MTPHYYAPLVILALVVFFLGAIVINILKYKSFKAALFEAPIDRTVGELTATRALGLLRTTIKIHVLGETPAGKSIGMELTARSKTNYQMMTVA
jgi:hypothetical protein